LVLEGGSRFVVTELLQRKHRVTALVVANDQIVRFGLRLMLQNITVAVRMVEAETRLEALKLAARSSFDLILVGLSGADEREVYDLLGDLATMNSETPVVAYTDDVRSFSKYCERAQLTCTCCPRGPSSAAELSQSIECLLVGHGLEEIDFVSDSGNPPAASLPDLLATLTPKEQEILAMVAAGDSSKRMAQFLGLSLRTVESHRARICAKLGVRTVAGLTKLAVRAGLTPLNEGSITR
jgi:DNA-binding NarL/FixJ family response regulator